MICTVKVYAPPLEVRLVPPSLAARSTVTVNLSVVLAVAVPGLTVIFPSVPTVQETYFEASFPLLSFTETRAVAVLVIVPLVFTENTALGDVLGALVKVSALLAALQVPFLEEVCSSPVTEPVTLTVTSALTV